MADSPPPTTTTEPEALEVRPPSRRLDRRFILWRTLNALSWATGVVGGAALLYALVPGVRPWLQPVLVILAAVYGVNIAIMPTLRYLIHRWETTDQAVYSLHGWLTREWRIVPISRIQSIDTVKGPLQQLLGLATIKVTTASREGGVTIEGLDSAVAEESVRRLNEIAQVTPGDAT
ncbi:PH domain-containing protein [Amycolatopsis lurida]